MKRLLTTLFVILLSLTEGYGQCPNKIKVNDTFTYTIIVPSPIGPVIFSQSFYEYKVTPTNVLSNDNLVLKNNQTGKKDTIRGVDSLFYSDTTVQPSDWTLTRIINNGSVTNCNTPLPVELKFFHAYVDSDHILLEWATASETNNRKFIVQRSRGNTWRNIEHVQGNGTSISPHQYSIKTKKIRGTTYYRLKQVNFDGSYEYSDIEAVKISRSTNKNRTKLLAPLYNVEIVNGKKKVIIEKD